MPVLKKSRESHESVLLEQVIILLTIIYIHVTNKDLFGAATSVLQSTKCYRYFQPQAVECRIHIQIDPTQASSPKQQENVQDKRVYHDPKQET